MIKAIGVLLVLSSCSGIGISLSHDLAKRIEMLKQIKRMILMIRGEIKYKNAYLQEAFTSVAKRVQDPYATFLYNVAGDLAKMDGRGIKDIWEENVIDTFEDTKLNDKDIELLRGLSENFGYLDKEMQLSNIDMYIDEVTSEIEESQSALPKKTRIINILGVMGGVFITIIIV